MTDTDASQAPGDASVGEPKDASRTEDAKIPVDEEDSGPGTQEPEGGFTLVEDEAMWMLRAGKDGKIYGVDANNDLRVFDGSVFSTIGNPCKATVGVVSAFVLHGDLPDAFTVAGSTGMGKASNGSCVAMTNLPFADGTARTLYEDSSGKLWVGTSQGAHRLDGATWTSFTKANSALGHDHVCAIQEDSAGTIWLGNCRALSGNPTDQFGNAPSTVVSDMLTLFSGNGIAAGGSRFVLDADGDLWMADGGFLSEALFSFDGTMWTTHPQSATGGGNIAHAVQVDPKTKDLFVATNEKLIQVHKGAGGVTFTAHGMGSGLPFENLIELAITGSGVMLVRDQLTLKLASGRPTL